MEFLAGRFCAKEAIYKALCSSFGSTVKIKPREISVRRAKDNSPHVSITARAVSESLADIMVSITHKGDLCASVALVRRQ